MKIPGSPAPPRMVLVAGDDQAGRNTHTAKPRNTSRNSGWTGGGQRRRSQRRLGRSSASACVPTPTGSRVTVSVACASTAMLLGLSGQKTANGRHWYHTTGSANRARSSTSIVRVVSSPPIPLEKTSP